MHESAVPAAAFAAVPSASSPVRRGSGSDTGGTGGTGTGTGTAVPTLAVNAELGDTLIFMDDGLVVEAGAPHDVIAAPRHERTKAFLAKVL